MYRYNIGVAPTVGVFSQFNPYIMEVEIFTLADYAADTGNGKLTIVGSFDTMYSQQMPILQTCSLVLKLRVANAHAGAHTVQLKFLAPDGKEFMPSPTVDANVVANPNADYVTIPIVMNFHPMKLNKLGKYGIELYYDGVFHSGLKLTVVQNIQVQKAA